MVARWALLLEQANGEEVFPELLPSEVIGLGLCELEDWLRHGITLQVNLSQTIAVKTLNDTTKLC